MKNIDITEVKQKLAKSFFFYIYYFYNETCDFIPDEFVLKIIQGNLSAEFTEKEISYIHYEIGLTDESYLNDSGNARSKVKKKLKLLFDVFRCEQKGETFISELGLSKRTYNALIKNDIISVEQLIMCSKEQLNNAFNLGKVLVEEIIDKVHVYGKNFIFDYPLEIQTIIIQDKKRINELLCLKESLKKFECLQSCKKEHIQIDINIDEKNKSLEVVRLFE